MENPTKYSGTNQQDLENFVSECQRAFVVRPITYKADLARVNYAQLFVKGRPATKWSNRPLDTPYTWDSFLSCLQDDIKPQHLRALDGEALPIDSPPSIRTHYRIVSSQEDLNKVINVFRLIHKQ